MSFANAVFCHTIFRLKTEIHTPKASGRCPNRLFYLMVMLFLIFYLFFFSDDCQMVHRYSRTSLCNCCHATTTYHRHFILHISSGNLVSLNDLWNMT